MEILIYRFRYLAITLLLVATLSGSANSDNFGGFRLRHSQENFFPSIGDHLQSPARFRETDELGPASQEEPVVQFFRQPDGTFVTKPPGYVVTGKLNQFVGFVTPQPRRDPGPPHRSDHVYGSIWAAWTHWSTCWQGEQLRVRACNTVRGFHCMGPNREARSCGTPPTRPPIRTRPPTQTPPATDSIVIHQEVFDYEHALTPFDPWKEDRRLAWEQLYGTQPKTTPAPLPAPRVRMRQEQPIPRSRQSVVLWVDSHAEAQTQRATTSTSTTTTTTTTPKPTTTQTPEPIIVPVGSAELLVQQLSAEEEEQHRVPPKVPKTEQRLFAFGTNRLHHLKGTMEIHEGTFMAATPDERLGPLANVPRFVPPLPVEEQAVFREHVHDHETVWQGSTIGHAPHNAGSWQSAWQPRQPAFRGQGSWERQPVLQAPLRQRVVEDTRAFPQPRYEPAEPFALSSSSKDVQVIEAPNKEAAYQPYQPVTPEPQVNAPVGKWPQEQSYTSAPQIHQEGPEQPSNWGYQATPSPQIHSAAQKYGVEEPEAEPSESININPAPGVEPSAPAPPVPAAPEVPSWPAPAPAFVPAPAAPAYSLSQGGYGYSPSQENGYSRVNAPKRPEPGLGQALVLSPIQYAEALAITVETPKLINQPIVPVRQVSSYPVGPPVAANQPISQAPAPPPAVNQGPGLEPQSPGFLPSNANRGVDSQFASAGRYPNHAEQIHRFQNSAKWSAWSSWSSCSCKTKSRTRTCDYSSSYLLQGCVGPSYQLTACEDGSCGRRPPSGQPPGFKPTHTGQALENSPGHNGGFLLEGEDRLRLPKPAPIPAQVSNFVSLQTLMKRRGFKGPIYKTPVNQRYGNLRRGIFSRYSPR